MTPQKVKKRRWKVKSSKKAKKPEEIIDILLTNRGLSKLSEKKEFFNPTHPDKISINELGLSKLSIKKAVSRIKKALNKNETIIVYGDYDADGICATAILWETLYNLTKQALPYIPERVSEGYGINIESVKELKTQYPKLALIITIDNGIVANNEIEKINQLGIDIIVSDHHQKGKVLPDACAIIHTEKISGSAISWIFSREIRRMLRVSKSKLTLGDGLELAAIGTVADQLPLIGVNRSFAYYGLEQLKKTERPGLLQLFKEANIDASSINTYYVNFFIAPRINAMGRMKHAIESLRLLCINSEERARKLALILGKTNSERQRVVDEVVIHAKEQSEAKVWNGAIVISHQSYHEGVIGLAAAKLVEEYWRPAIVVSEGSEISKASARSIPGFNIIEMIRKFDDLLDGGGGHPMAAGFSIKTKNLKVFAKKFEEESSKLLSKDVLTRQTIIDMEIKFSEINWKLTQLLKGFEPTGLGNPTPTFVTFGVDVFDAKTVGNDGKHLKLKLKNSKIFFDAIGFGLGGFSFKAEDSEQVDIVYSIEENVWNGSRNIQLKVRDIRINK